MLKPAHRGTRKIVPSRAFCNMGRPRADPQLRAGCLSRRVDAQAACQPLSFWAQKGRLVEMETGPTDHRGREDLCPTRPRAARQPVHRLHDCRLERHRPCPLKETYFRLTDGQFRKITAWVKTNTHESFGPVRSVTPEHVFEIALESIQFSPRHKSEIALRFPRMYRWRHDKSIQDTNSLDDLNQMLATYG